MPLSFAGVALEPPPDSLGALGAWWHSGRISQWEFQGYLVPGIQHLPNPYPPSREPPRVGVLSWPTGADRFATCHLLATGTQADAVRTAVGASPTAKPLVFTDGTVTVTADMHVVIQPISQRGDGHELYLLTFVDDRFFWWQSGCGTITAPSSWADLFTKLFALVGVTPTVDSVPAAYLTPNPARWVSGKSLRVPAVIEAAARQVGMRVVRRLDGSVRVQSFATADAEDSARWTAFASLAMAGGRLTGADVGRISPASVDVCFFDDTTTNVTLTSLALSSFGGVSGVAAKKAVWTADPAAPTGAQKTTYATQAAKDYYNWNLALTDADLRSFRNANPCGLDDCIEWVHDPSLFVTRIVRPQWSDRNVYGEKAPSAVGTGSAPEYLDECVNGFLIRKRAVISLDASGLSQTSYVFDKSLGIRCAPETGSVPPGSSGPPGPIPDPNQKFPTVTDSVATVCPDAHCREPVGAVGILASAFSGTCFLKADGSAVSRATYADLFAAYGTTFGAGDGSTTFKLPTLANPVTGLSYFVRAFAESLTVQTQRTTVAAFGSVTNPFCVVDPNDCCPGSVPPERTDCCGSATAADAISFAGEGPLNAGCATCTVTGDLVRVGTDVLTWALAGAPAGCADASQFDLTLYCSRTEWRAAGRVRPGGFADVIYFDVELEADPVSGILFGAVEIPDCGDVTLAFEVPCDPHHGRGTWDCVSGHCVFVDGPGGQYATLILCELACGGTIPAACPDGHNYTHAAVSNQTGACTCFTGLSYGGGGGGDVVSVYTMVGACEGNPAFHLHCTGGLWALEVVGVGYCTLVAYAPGTMVFDTPNMAPNCSGTARVTLTG